MGRWGGGETPADTPQKEKTPAENAAMTGRRGKKEEGGNNNKRSKTRPRCSATERNGVEGHQVTELGRKA
jgi:hypothetical protein